MTTPDTPDWRRMSEPQVDGYDTLALLALPQEILPVPRRAAQAAGDVLAVADEQVRLDHDQPLLPAPRYRPSEGVPDVFRQATAYVERWPAMAAQWPRIVHTVQCFTDVVNGGPLKSSSHSVGARPGVIALTVDCPLATAQAIVHETAHHKLRAMGVANETARRLILNPSEDLFRSPVVTEMLRPMTAVLHAQYSFMHVLQLDLCMLEFEEDPAVRKKIKILLARNVPRMTQGLATLRRHAAFDEPGRRFFDGFAMWCEAALASGRALLRLDTGHDPSLTNP